MKNLNQFLKLVVKCESDRSYIESKVNDLIISSFLIGFLIGGVPQYSAPTQSLLQKWLRGTHKIEISVLPVLDSNMEILTYSYTIYLTNKKVPEDYDVRLDNRTFEDALEEALLEGLKLINKI